MRAPVRLAVASWRRVRVYAPAITLGAWSGLWALGVHGDGLIAAGLAATAGAVIDAELERGRRRRESC